jgi:hypothetical protein
MMIRRVAEGTIPIICDYLEKYLLSGCNGIILIVSRWVISGLSAFGFVDA